MNHSSSATTKTELRRLYRARRAAMTAEQRQRAAGGVRAVLVPHIKRVAPGGAIAVYLATAVELDLDVTIRALMDAGHAVAAPRGDGFALLAQPDGLEKDERGLGVPDGPAVEVEQIQLFLIPGVAFTTDGARLGQGGGWYDRLLVRRCSHAQCIGIAFEEQLAAQLPVESHDVRMDCIATPERWVQCGPAEPVRERQREQDGC